MAAAILLRDHSMVRLRGFWRGNRAMPLQSIGTRAATICSLPLPENFYLLKET
jgi:hypothetical protein